MNHMKTMYTLDKVIEQAHRNMLNLGDLNAQLNLIQNDCHLDDSFPEQKLIKDKLNDLVEYTFILYKIYKKERDILIPN